MTDLPPPPPPVTTSQGDSWIKRNWGWAIPGGCCGCLVISLLMFAAIAMLVVGMFRNSEVVQQAMERAATDPELVQELGTPLKAGYLISGNLQTSGSSGTADLLIPISGPKGSGSMVLVAVKSGGTWTFTTLKVSLSEAEEQLNLLPGE
jgi:hypothetical protein